MEDEARKMSVDLETKLTIVSSAPALNLENITEGFMERQDEFENVAEIDVSEIQAEFCCQSGER